MSILIKPYEISVWEDAWESGKFTEKRIAVIGSDKMNAQCRAINPSLTRNVNGLKTFSFEMYKTYQDIVTGEKTENPFIDLLTNERKVKLYYEGLWNDFIIKNVTENSNSHLYSYTLEDAFVNELSKNGFNVEINAELRNNLGTAQELASYVLKDTDWTVSEWTEAFVQTNEEALVYLTTPPLLDDANSVYHITDQQDLRFGVSTEKIRGNLYPERATQFDDAFSSWIKQGTWEVESGKTDYYGNKIVVNTSAGEHEYIYQLIAPKKIEKYTLTAVLNTTPELQTDGSDITAKLADLVCRVDEYNNTEGPATPASKENLIAWPVYASENWTCHKLGGNDNELLVSITFDLTNKATKSFRAKIECKENTSKKIHISSLAIRPTAEWLEGKEVLAFYSSCKDKPARFQFIHVADKAYLQDDKRILINPHAQYYIDYAKLDEDYLTPSGTYQFCLPSGFKLNDPGAGFLKPNINGETKTDEQVISIYLRGKRYTFAQKLHYVSLLDKYMNIYNRDGKEYYGSVESTYVAPSLITNLVDNTEFLSTSGWSSGKQNDTEDKPEISITYGRWGDTEGQTKTSFIDVQTDWANGVYANDSRRARLKITTETKPGLVINSGFYSNRTLIKNISPSQRYVVRLKLLDSEGKTIGHNDINSYLRVQLCDIVYSTNNGCYNILDGYFTQKDNDKTWFLDDDGYVTCTFSISNKSEKMTEAQFKNKKIKLVFYIAEGKTFYIEDAQLFQYIPATNGGYLTPDSQPIEASVIRTYTYYPCEQFDTITNIEDLESHTMSYPDYYTYKPVYADGAQKIRTITEKESNYFNILQNIAQTFEAWLDIDVVHDVQGHPIYKKVLFKNYAGDQNHAGFKYGVNLKDVQRTKDGSKLTTKLIVKNNYNQHAEGGMCSIMNAPSNESGENVLYSFDYYIGAGLLNATDLNNYLHHTGCHILDYWKNQLGITSSDIGYYSYLSILNTILKNKNNALSPLLISQNKIKSDKIVAETTLSSATDALETLGQDFEDLTGYPYTGISTFDPVLMVDKAVSLKVSYEVNDNITLTNELQPADQSALLAILNTKADTTRDSTKPLVTVSGNSEDKTTTLSVQGLELLSFGKTDEPSTLSLPLVQFYEMTGGEKVPVNQSYTINLVTNKSGKEDVLELLKTPIDSTLSFIHSVPQKYTITKVSYSFTKEPKDSEVFEVLAEDITKLGPSNVYQFVIPKEVLNTDAASAIRNSGTGTVYLSIEQTLAQEWQDYQNEYSSLPDREDVQGLLWEIYTTSDKLRNASESLLEYETQLLSLGNEINNLNTEIKLIQDEKDFINKQFYSKYYRFIQEGTWVSEEYIDPELYYIDAQSVLYESCYPAVTYTINAIELSNLEGYELLSYGLGDRTFVEDQEFFGAEGRVEVVVTEKTDLLDRPDQGSIKMQTYKNQFQELFQKITATVQTAQYNTGANNKAIGLANANNAQKQVFLEGAVNDISSLLTNVGECAVEQDTTGIIIKDLASKGNQIKLTSGGILLGKFNEETGETRWVHGLSSKGISADELTTGKINTGEISIMNGRDATFRWDAFGLSAYDFSGEDGGLKVNPNRFVRFDKYGLYGIDGKDGSVWRASSFKDGDNSIKNNAAFYLTWDGLSVAPGNLKFTKGNGEEIAETSPAPYITKLGRIDDQIFNDWDIETGMPIYSLNNTNAPKFVKVFSVGDYTGQNASEKLVIYSDGTLVAENIKLPGSIEWTEASSPSKNVYAKTALDKPTLRYNNSNYPEADIGSENSWHRNYETGVDKFYCHTDDGGSVWQGPFSIVGEPGKDGPAGPAGPAGKDGDSSENVFIYLRTDEVPEKPAFTTTIDSWSTQFSDDLLPTSDRPYTFRSTGVKKTTINDEGKEVSVYSDWTIPELYLAYKAGLTDLEETSITQYEQAAAFYKLFGLEGNKQGAGYYENGKFLINADFIQAGTLTVGGTDENPVFNASMKDGTVQIAGWDATQHLLSSGDVGMYSGDDLSLQSLVNPSETSPLRFFAGKETDAQGNVSYNFAALDDGSVYMQTAQIGEDCLLTDSGGSKQTVKAALDQLNTAHADLQEYGSSLQQQLRLYQNIIDIFLGIETSIATTAELPSDTYLYSGQGLFAGGGRE